MALMLKTLKTGADDEPVFLLLHGFGGSADVWADIAYRVKGTVLALDLPGHGTSLHHPAAGRAGPMAEAIAEALIAADLPPVHLCGHSMGGAVASLLAAQHPARVASLLLLAPGGFGPDIDALMMRDFAAAGDAIALRHAMGAMCAPNFELPEDIIQQSVAFRQAGGQLAQLIATGARITKNETQGVIPRAMLEGISCPVRLIWGQKDALLPAKQILHAPPHFEPLLLDGMGHMLIEEAPDLIISHLNDMAAI